VLGEVAWIYAQQGAIDQAVRSCRQILRVEPWRCRDRALAAAPDLERGQRVSQLMQALANALLTLAYPAC
jgi:hypothetical protein